MRRILFSVILLSALPARGRALQGQEAFGLSPSIESAAIPDLNTSLLIEGNVDQEVEFTGNLILTTGGITGEEGPQGWSLGIRNDVVSITATTVAGTVSASISKGGLVDGGFVVNELIDPAKKGNDGKQGSVQAVVLSFTLPVSLPPNTAQLIGKNTYKAKIAAAESTGLLKFEDGLIGKGQPVANNVTFKGVTKIPTLGEKRITIRAKVEPKPEVCTDGQDNDLDGKIDCADTDCASEAICKEAGNCADGKDNDLDGKIDAADEDCQAPPTKGFDVIMATANSRREGKKNVVEIDCAAAPSFDAIVSIERTQDPEPNGAQGWSLSVAHEGAKLKLQNPTIDGTDAAALFDGGFKKTESIDPAKNGGKSGWVSGVVLSFTLPITLDPAKNQTVAKANYMLTGAAGDLPTTILFTNGLRGKGEPIDNVITVNSSSVTPSNLISLEVRCGVGPPPGAKFVRGNANDDNKVNLADPIWIISELVRQGPKTLCQDAADANDDGLLDLSDAMYLITWQFMAGPPPSSPYPACGEDATQDTLNCPAGSSTVCP